ncbi:hypothetical protein EMMF5_002467 [Cystobasidiomycetes sp. EMM_F5]
MQVKLSSRRSNITTTTKRDDTRSGYGPSTSAVLAAAVLASAIHTTTASPVNVRQEGRAPNPQRRVLGAIDGLPRPSYNILQQRAPVSARDVAYSTPSPTVTGGVGVTPSGMANHYQLVAGVWVPSDEWSLNGKAGNSPVVSTTTLPSHTETIGAVRSTNVVLGIGMNVDASNPTDDAAMDVAGTSMPTPTITSIRGTGTPSGIVNAAASATFVTLSSSSSVSTTDSSGAAIDYSSDIPNGWVPSSRTEAYAVPLIIGLSVFLACVIFGSICLLVRRGLKSRQRRKYGTRLEEEGRGDGGNESFTHSRPGSIRQGHGARKDGDDEKRLNGAKQDSNVAVAKWKRKLIGRRWSPNNDGRSGSTGLRNRKRNIAQLFNRHDARAVDEAVEETVAIHAQSSAADPLPRSDTLDTTITRSSSPSPSNRYNGDGASLARTQSTASSYMSMSSRPILPQHHQDIPAINLIPPSNASREDLSMPRMLLRPQSNSPLSRHIARTAAAAAAEAQSPTSPSAAIPSRHDTHAVPLPTVGPPAYIPPAPPSPAYTNRSSVQYFAPPSPFLPLESGGPAGERTDFFNSALATAREEKAALLMSRSGSTMSEDAMAAQPTPGSSSDPFRFQRQYEHLYASREGDSSQTRAASPAAAASGSSVQVLSQESEGDWIARSTARTLQRTDEEEDILEQRANLAAHVAVDDKSLLSSIRNARSAPDAIGPPEREADADLVPSAPSVDDENEYETDADTMAMSSVAESSMPRHASPLLPAPPQAFRTSVFVPSPLLDEKTRLRQAEEAQSAQLAPHVGGPYAPFGLQSRSAPSPSAPSAPDFGLQEDMPSAPPLNEDVEESTIVHVSAPAFPSNNNDLHTVHEVATQQRPFYEGVV